MGTDEHILTMLREDCARILAVPADEVTPEAQLREDLEADSLDFAELGMALEDRIGFKIPDDEFTKVVTVGDVAGLVQRQARERGVVIGA